MNRVDLPTLGRPTIPIVRATGDESTGGWSRRAARAYPEVMTFDEIFNPGAGHAREQEAVDKVRPATEVVGEAPPFDDDARDQGVVIPPVDDVAPFEPKRRDASS